MRCHSPASLLEGVKEVRSEVLSLFIPTSRELVGSRTKWRQQRWRDGTLGIQPQRDKGCMRSQTPPPLWGGGRGRGNTEQPPSTPPPLWGGGQGAGPIERLRIFLGNYFVMHFFLKKHLSSCVYQRNFVPLSPYSFRVNLENDSKTTRKRHDSISIKINHNYYGKSRF